MGRRVLGRVALNLHQNLRPFDDIHCEPSPAHPPTPGWLGMLLLTWGGLGPRGQQVSRAFVIPLLAFQVNSTHSFMMETLCPQGAETRLLADSGWRRSVQLWATPRGT